MKKGTVDKNTLLEIQYRKCALKLELIVLQFVGYHFFCSNKVFLNKLEYELIFKFSLQIQMSTSHNVTQGEL